MKSCLGRVLFATKYLLLSVILTDVLVNGAKSKCTTHSCSDGFYNKKWGIYDTNGVGGNAVCCVTNGKYVDRSQRECNTWFGTTQRPVGCEEQDVVCAIDAAEVIDLMLENTDECKRALGPSCEVTCPAGETGKGAANCELQAGGTRSNWEVDMSGCAPDTSCQGQDAGRQDFCTEIGTGCVNISGGLYKSCTTPMEGFTVNQNGKVTDLDECKHDGNASCDPNARCTNKDHSISDHRYICECNQGYGATSGEIYFDGADWSEQKPGCQPCNGFQDDSVCIKWETNTCRCNECATGMEPLHTSSGGRSYEDSRPGGAEDGCKPCTTFVAGGKCASCIATGVRDFDDACRESCSEGYEGGSATRACVLITTDTATKEPEKVTEDHETAEPCNAVGEPEYDAKLCARTRGCEWKDYGNCVSGSGSQGDRCLDFQSNQRSCERIKCKWNAGDRLAECVKIKSSPTPMPSRIDRPGRETNLCNGMDKRTKCERTTGCQWIMGSGCTKEGGNSGGSQPDSNGSDQATCDVAAKGSDCCDVFSKKECRLYKDVCELSKNKALTKTVTEGGKEKIVFLFKKCVPTRSLADRPNCSQLCSSGKKGPAECNAKRCKKIKVGKMKKVCIYDQDTSECKLTDTKKTLSYFKP